MIEKEIIRQTEAQSPQLLTKIILRTILITQRYNIWIPARNPHMVRSRSSTVSATIAQSVAMFSLHNQDDKENVGGCKRFYNPYLFLLKPAK